MTQTGSQRRGVKMLRGVDAAGDTAPNVVEYELGVVCERAEADWLGMSIGPLGLGSTSLLTR